MIVTSTNDIKDFKVTEYLGLINANIVLGANFISDIFASFSDFFGGYSNSYQSKLDEIYNKALNELQAKAKTIKADAVIGVHFDFDEISGQGKSMFMVTAYGTAVKIESMSQSIKKNDRYEIYQKLYDLSKFKESGIITSEQYEIEKANLLLNHEEKIKVETIKSENEEMEAIKQAQTILEQQIERQKDEDKIQKLKLEELSQLRKKYEPVISQALTKFKTNKHTIYNTVKRLLESNIEFSQTTLDNLSIFDIQSVFYEDITIESIDEMSDVIAHYIKEGKIAEACKLYIDFVEDDNIEYAKMFIYGVYEDMTLQDEIAFENLMQKIIDLKYLNMVNEAIYELMERTICDKSIAKQIIDIL
jgi:uncharacterized protein YbjQ (UPF0145 family)